MTEKILKIEEINGSIGGFKITTTEQEIDIVIDNTSQCCEHFGYIASEDDISEYIGSELIGISVVEYNESSGYHKKLIGYEDYGVDEGNAYFVDLKTNKGTLVFSVYNSHNGYYGHSVEIKSNKFNIEGYI